MNLLQLHTDFIKKTAPELGFDYCGIAAAVPLTEDARRLENWLNHGYHGTMEYMSRHFELRTDPTKLVPGAKSVITLCKNYFSNESPAAGSPRVSKYAYGNDYHEVIRKQLHEFLARLREKAGDVQGRGFVDSAPVLERSWAQRSGLGWVGKNGNLISKQSGSFFFIATLITDLPLIYDDPFARDYCGSCTRCIDACPTGAILPGRVVDGSRCISYFTIELKEQLIPGNMKGKFENWLFGCDTCQDVCPWNRFSTPHQEAAFDPIPGMLQLSATDWEVMTEDAFKKMFRHSPLRRTKFAGIQRNLKFLLSDATEKKIE